MSNDLIIAGRRNFLVRAMGFIAAPAAAVPAIAALPTISPDLVAKMQVWRNTFGQYLSAQEAYQRSGVPFADYAGGTMTPEYAAYTTLQFEENDVRNEMLRAILKTN